MVAGAVYLIACGIRWLSRRLVMYPCDFRGDAHPLAVPTTAVEGDYREQGAGCGPLVPGRRGKLAAREEGWLAELWRRAADDRRILEAYWRDLPEGGRGRCMTRSIRSRKRPFLR